MRNPFIRQKESIQPENATEQEQQDNGESDNSETLFGGNEGFSEYDSRSQKIEKNLSRSRPRRPPSIADTDDNIVVTRQRVVRDLDKIRMPELTTQLISELPTITFAKHQMLQRRRDRKVIDEKIRINLREENDEFNEETQQEYDELYDDDSNDDLGDDDFDD